MSMIDDVPALHSNLVAVTPIAGGLRVTFAEQTTVEDAPVARTAVFLDGNAAKELLRVLMQVLTPQQETKAPAKKARARK